MGHFRNDGDFTGDTFNKIFAYVPQRRFQLAQVGVEFVPADAERLGLGHVAVGGGEEGVVALGELLGLGVGLD